MSDQLSTWTTTDEIEYLNSIGSHAVLGRSPHDRRDLLEGYAEALKYRPRSKYLDFTKLHEKVWELLNDGGIH